jgi:hypothetical protein
VTDAVNNQNAGRSPEAMLRALLQIRRIQHPYMIILSEEPTPIRQRDSSIPAKLAEVVDRAVRKDPAGRFRTAAEFSKALASV